jgi:hypothetical protein
MSRTRTRYTTTTFACSLVGRTVHIHRTYTILVGQMGEELARAVVKTDCSEMDTCGIATHHDTVTSFDWSKCAFVKSQEAQS